jgi:hypothetical protein
MHTYLVACVLALALATLQVLGETVIPYFLDFYSNTDCLGPIVSTTVAPELPAIYTCLNVGTSPAKIKGVPTIIGSILVNCPANTFTYGVGTICDTQRFRLKDLCVLYGTQGFKLRCVPDVCRASTKLTEKKCNARIARCAKYGYLMRW